MTVRNRNIIVGMDESPHGSAGEYTVTLRMGDQLRAELEGKRQGLAEPHKNPLHLQALFAWAAMVREGHFTGKFGEFKTACAFTEDESEDEDAGTPVDPTDQPASPDSA